MSASNSRSRASYEISLVSEKDSRWADDKSQTHCYVCTKAKLSRGKRHHCRLCGNLACNECCPRICKRCLAENIASSSVSLESANYEPIQRLCKLKSQQMRWKQVTMIDKSYYEPVYIVHEDSTNICIVRTMDGDYYACDHSILLLAPEKENILDSLQCLLHAFINRSAESSISFKRPIYSLQESETSAILNSALSAKQQQRRASKLKMNAFSIDYDGAHHHTHGHGAQHSNSKMLQRCKIFSFFPMLQQTSYKLDGFIFKSSLSKMYLGNVQLFHYVADDEQPKQIPAWTPPISMGAVTANKHNNNMDMDDEKLSPLNVRANSNNNEIIISANSRRKSASLSNLKGKNIAVLELELESFKKGYQEMRKMYEEYVNASEAKLKEAQKREQEHEESIEHLQDELDQVTQQNAKYKQALDLNATRIMELEQKLNALSIEYQEKLNSQSSKFKSNTEKTTTDAQSQLIESYKNLEEANEKIETLTQEIEALKTLNSTPSTTDQVIQFRLEKEQRRCKQLEVTLNDKQEELLQAKQQIAELSQRKQSSNDHEAMVNQPSIKDTLCEEYEQLFKVDHKQLFDLLFDLMKSYRSLWNEEYLYCLIYELLFTVLVECYRQISRYEKSVSSSLCKELSINKPILYESFYHEWIKNSNYHIFLHSTDKMKKIKSEITESFFVHGFLVKHLELNSHQISEEIHMKFAAFIEKSVNISWKMCIQSPLLAFTPTRFNVEQIDKIKCFKELHSVFHGNHSYEYILYYIWPVISHNDCHSIDDKMKVQVCLGGALPDKSVGDDTKEEGQGGGMRQTEQIGNNPTDVADEHDDEDDSVGMMIFNHDDNYSHQIGDEDSYYDHHLQDEY